MQRRRASSPVTQWVSKLTQRSHLHRARAAGSIQPLQEAEANATLPPHVRRLAGASRVKRSGKTNRRRSFVSANPRAVAAAIEPMESRAYLSGIAFQTSYRLPTGHF